MGNFGNWSASKNDSCDLISPWSWFTKLDQFWEEGRPGLYKFKLLFYSMVVEKTVSLRGADFTVASKYMYISIFLHDLNPSNLPDYIHRPSFFWEDARDTIVFQHISRPSRACVLFYLYNCLVLQRAFVGSLSPSVVRISYVVTLGKALIKVNCSSNTLADLHFGIEAVTCIVHSLTSKM